MDSDALIDRLRGDLRPVRPMPSPGRQAALWLLAALAANAAMLALDGVRPDLAARLAMPAEVAQWVSSVATGIAAALAAAMLARPGRPGGWALLPVPPLLAWLGALGWGSFADLGRLGAEAWRMSPNWGCVVFVGGSGLPLAVGLLLLLRHAGPVRPVPVLLLGGVAAAALASAACSLAHGIDAMLMLLVWHGAAAVLVAVLAWTCGRPLLLRAPRAGATPPRRG